MRTALIYAMAGVTSVAFGSALVAAPEQGPRPGDMNRATVWVQNRGAAEAIPVSVQGADSAIPLRVQLVGATTSVSTRRVQQAWEYRQVRVPPDQEVAQTLNALGAEGWETTGVQMTPTAGPTVLVMKRPR